MTTTHLVELLRISQVASYDNRKLFAALIEKIDELENEINDIKYRYVLRTDLD